MSSAELARRRRDRQRTRYAAIAIAALSVASCLALFLGPAAPAQAPARLEVVAAAVELWAPGERGFDAVSVPTDLAAGSAIRTSSSGLAEIAFGDGSLTRVGPDTTYTLSTLRIGPDARQIVGRLDVGRTFHRVSEATGSGSRFEVQTSKAVAAVRGTAFSVQCLTPHTCEIDVTEGTVAVITPDGVSVDVKAGRRIVVGANGSGGALEDTPASDPWIRLNTTPPPSSGPSPTSPEAPGPAGTDATEIVEPSPGATGFAPASPSENNPGTLSTTSIPRLPGPSRPTATSTPATPSTSGSTATSTPSSTASTNTTTSLPAPGLTGTPPLPTTVPTTAPPVGPDVLCPGDKDGAERTPGFDSVTTCQPCEVGETVLHNPNCPEGN